MSPLATNRHGPIVGALLEPGRLNELGPGTPNLEARSRLAAFSWAEALQPRQIRDDLAARACLAGLWLYHDFPDESHAISQEIDTRDGSYWHAILHRREPDASNSAYWFRRVGTHAIFGPLASDARAMGARFRQHRWDPFEFIDLCEEHRGRADEQELLLRRIQHREWELLFDHCFRQALG